MAKVKIEVCKEKGRLSIPSWILRIGVSRLVDARAVVSQFRPGYFQTKYTSTQATPYNTLSIPSWILHINNVAVNEFPLGSLNSVLDTSVQALEEEGLKPNSQFRPGYFYYGASQAY